jgi:hypothetical protein
MKGLARASVTAITVLACHQASSGVSSRWMRDGAYVFEAEVAGTPISGRFTIEEDSLYMHSLCAPGSKSRAFERPPTSSRGLFLCRDETWLYVDVRSPLRGTSWYRQKNIATPKARCVATQVMRQRIVCVQTETTYTYKSTWVSGPVRVRRAEDTP